MREMVSSVGVCGAAAAYVCALRMAGSAMGPDELDAFTTQMSAFRPADGLERTWTQPYYMFARACAAFDSALAEEDGHLAAAMTAAMAATDFAKLGYRNNALVSLEATEHELRLSDPPLVGQRARHAITPLVALADTTIATSGEDGSEATPGENAAEIVKNLRRELHRLSLAAERGPGTDVRRRRTGKPTSGHFVHLPLSRGDLC